MHVGAYKTCNIQQRQITTCHALLQCATPQLGGWQPTTNVALVASTNRDDAEAAAATNEATNGDGDKLQFYLCTDIHTHGVECLCMWV